ncbi:hypothetical protein ACLOJK_033930 [Asimina triloba]
MNPPLFWILCWQRSTDLQVATDGDVGSLVPVTPRSTETLCLLPYDATSKAANLALSRLETLKPHPLRAIPGWLRLRCSGTFHEIYRSAAKKMPEITEATEKNLTISPTSSLSVTKTINGSHKFVIQGYSLAKGMGIGKHIASDNFTVGGYQWAIYFYPDGKNPEDNSTYVSVFIALASEGTDVRALFELTLVDQSGKEKHKVHSHFDRSLESGPYTLKYRGSMW